MDFELLSSDFAEEVARGRMAEFVELYSRHYPRLQFYIMALLPTANDAADVLQETSLVLWRKFDSFQSGTNFFAWACKIARLQALKHRERQGRSGQVFELSVLEKLAEEASREESGYAVPLVALENCIKKLSETDRSLIRKRYQPGASVNQIARDIGRSANSISKSLGRIRRALLVCVERALLQEGRE
jgi:RNA polymerase sigma-70 factor (ECF subfamily)